MPVLVVGAGPAGLAAPIELTRHDIPSLLVERRRRLALHPHATVLSLRSMELVRAWGLDGDVHARTRYERDDRLHMAFRRLGCAVVCQRRLRAS